MRVALPMSPLARALPAMTSLQATVALGAFTLSALAPQLGLSVLHLAALNTLLFTVGAAGALWAGWMITRWGDWTVAALCALAVAAGMACLLAGGPLGPWLAALLFGIAFGPETPASAAVLSRLTPPARRPWVFSVRQTGNQIGAIAGSLALPLLIVANPRLPYLVVGLLAVAMALWCGWLSRDHRLEQDAAAGSPADAVTRTPLPTRAALHRISSSPRLRALSFAALCFTAVQMCLNTFLLSLAVREWSWDVRTASMAVAGLQAAGLAGRLFWGWLAQRSASAARLLGGLGLLMAASGAVVMASPPSTGGFGLGLGLAIAVLGFSASGWNGVLVAEVSRLAGPHHAGALTGAVLMFGYAGLALAPLAFAALSAALSMAAAFGVLFAAAGIAGAWLLRDPR